MGTTTLDSLTNSVALLSSDYPYIAVPEGIYTPLVANLTALGFVCFPSPYPQFLHCDVAKSCDEMSYDLPDLTIEFTSLTEGPFTVDIPATVYLMQQEGNTQCETLIS